MLRGTETVLGDAGADYQLFVTEEAEVGAMGCPVSPLNRCWVWWWGAAE